MNHATLKIAAVTIPLALAGSISCSSGPKPQETVIQTPDGAAIIDTYQIEATVAAVDPVKRKVTLVGPDGKKTSFKAGKNQDISQLKAGDRLQATLTEEVAVSLRKGDGAAPSAAEASAVVAAKSNGETAVMMGDQVELTSKVSAVDAAKRRVTLQLPDGSSRTIKAGKNIDLSKVSVGDDVVVQITEAVAIDFQKKSGGN